MKMDKEKKIDIVSRYHAKNDLANALYQRQDEFDLSNPFEVANCVINLGYRKINENDVVLTREDMSKYAEDCIAGQETGLDIINALIARAERYKKQAKELEEQRDKQAYITEDLIQEKHRWTEQARKETAKEIMEMIKEYYGSVSILKSISIRYGVDLGEEK